MDVHYNGGNSGYVIFKHIEANKYDSEDCSNLLPWLKFCEIARVIMAQAIYRSVMQEDLFSKHRTLYIVREDAVFTSEGLKFFKHVKLQNGSLEMPVKVLHTTSKILNTSVIYEVEIIDMRNGNVLMKGTMILVFINQLTRRPTKFSEKFKTFINSQRTIKLQHSMIDQPLKSVPTKTPVYSWSRNINMLDTDQNGHANHTLYLMTSLQCLEYAWFESFVVGYDKPFREYVVKNISLIVNRESHNGQIIIVQLWQTENRFNFVLNVAEKVVACAAILLTEAGV